MPISERIIEAAKDVVSSKVSDFKARNGKMVGIQDDSGEKMWIVPFDEMFELEAALAASPSDAERQERAVPEIPTMQPPPLPREDGETWKQVLTIFKDNGEGAPSWRLRDRLVGILVWAQYGHAVAMSAAPSPPAAVKEPVAVKTLEWEEPRPTAHYPEWRAHNLTVGFEALIDTHEPVCFGKFPLRINGTMVKEKFSTVGAAKAYAQTKYEGAVRDIMRSSLSTSQSDPSTEMAGNDMDQSLWRFWNEKALQQAVEIAALRAYAHEATKVITGLAGGGSENFSGQIGDMFKADLELCAKKIRDRHEMIHGLVVKAKKDNDTLRAENERLRESANAVVQSASDHYKKRNGHLASFEDESGEKCWIVPFDAFEDLRAALTHQQGEAK